MRTADEIRVMVGQMQVAAPPVSAQDAVKIQWLTLQLLQEIACGLADLTSKGVK